MGDPLPPDARMTALIRRLDELIAEAQHLRDDIKNATREKPVWPDRRRLPRPHGTDKKK